MLDFIVKYWVQFLFGLIIAGVSAFFKHHMKLQREHDDAEREALRQEMRQITQQEHISSNERIERLEQELEALKSGTLSVQGKLFREFCEELLIDYETIPVEVFEQMELDYAAYKKLGGNHRGDALHNAVVKKFETQVNK